MSRPRFGYPRVLVMLQREGWDVGKMRVYRLYGLEGLQLRMKGVCLEACFRQTGRCVGQALDRSAVLRGWPKAITVDNGTEFTSRALDDWAYRRGIKLDYTRPGKPTDNGLIESFDGRLRDEFLNVHEFITLHDLQQKLRAWQDDYNHHRPHGSLGDLTPRECVQKWSVQPKEAATLQF